VIGFAGGTKAGKNDNHKNDTDMIILPDADLTVFYNELQNTQKN
jgi:hypothetical protein